MIVGVALLMGCGGSSTTPSNSTGTLFQLVVHSSGTGTVTSNPAGINCGSACSGSFASGSKVTLSASPAANSYFSGWGGACSGRTECTITLNANSTVTVNFTSNPGLTVQLAGTGSGSVTSNPNGVNCGSTCSAVFAAGTIIVLTPTASQNSTFSGWSGACSGTGPCQVTLQNSAEVTATFLLAPTLSVTVSGSGSITSKPAGINCGATCTSAFAAGTQVTLTALPGTSSFFTGWNTAGCEGVGTCTFTIRANTSVSATFSSTPTLTITDNGNSSGTVTSNPPGIACGQICSQSFPYGTQITLTAIPDPGVTFGGWNGKCSGVGPCVLTLDGSTQVTASFSKIPINHIIFLAQENRSLDHYLGALRQYWANNGYPDQAFDGLPQFNPTGNASSPTNPGCNPADPFQPPGPGSSFQDCVFDTSMPVTSFHLKTMCVENPSPSWNESHVAWNYNDPTGLLPAVLNGFVFNAGHDSRDEYYYGNILQDDVNGQRAMGYYDGNDLNYYYFMASNFATSDRWFNPVMSRTNPNREYLIGATSWGYAYPNGTNANDMAQIPTPVIFQEMQAAGITWKVYVYPNPQAAQYGTLFCAANDTRPECLYRLTYLQNFAYGQTIVNQYPENIVPISQFYTDAQNGTLPQVAQIEPASAIGLDEHAADYDTSPACCSVQAGAAYVEGLIGAVMGTPSAPSPSWKDSVFILTYDEFGGFYDHVSPQLAALPGDFAKPVDLFQGPPQIGPDICVSQTGPTCSFDYTGYRVPLIVISPFTKKNFVSHTVADTTAILKLIETRFGLPALSGRDAAEMDMTEFFDFSNPPWMTPPAPPAQNTGGACYLNQLP